MIRLALAFCLLSACSQPRRPVQWTGTWSLYVVDTSNKVALKDTLRFFPNDSFQLRLFAADTLLSEFNGRYNFNPEESVLTIQADSTTFRFILVRSEENEVVLKQQQTGVVSRYRKIASTP